MQKVMRKMLLAVLIMALLLPNNAFASVSGIELDTSQLVKTVGYKVSEDLKDGLIDGDQKVRIIVELYETPIIELATDLGISVTEMGPELLSELQTSIAEDQASVIDAVEGTSDAVEIHEQFSNVYNGFSTTVLMKDVEAIAANPLVKSVSLSNIYERPEPLMTTSTFFTKSDYVNQALGYSGEGMVVAIIDTGIDPSHQDFVLDEGTDMALTQGIVDASLSLEGDALPGMYYTEKVPYGYNYMDNDHEIRDIAVGASMHGMHVAGTVAANGEIKGVAPNAQVLAMKVFGNDPAFESTFGDIIIAAIDDSIALGADVMNLSLGSTAAFVDASDPEQIAVERAVENGIVMAISAGNSSYAGDGVFGSLDLIYGENPDVGVVGSPGLSTDAIQVASINNFTYLYETSVEVLGFDLEFNGYGKDEWAIEDDYELVAIGGSKLGVPEDYVGLDVAGKVVLVSRGALSFYDKTVNAAAAGAAGIIVYDHGEAQFYYDQGGWDIPFMKISKEDGLLLEDLLATEGSLELAMTYGPDGQYVDPVTGYVSEFSSWGTTPDLSFKPEIAAPGGNIYSTFNDDSYGYMSGTSMAAPHVAGGSALMLERIKEDPIFEAIDLDGDEAAILAKNILMNTATPVVSVDNQSLASALTDIDGLSSVDLHSALSGLNSLLGYASPRQQGAGSMNLMNAMATKVVVTEKESGLGKVNLGEIQGNTFSFTLNMKNYGEEAALFMPNGNLQTDAAFWGYDGLTSVEIPSEITYEYGGETLGAYDYIYLPGLAEEDLVVHMTMDQTAYAYTQSNFPNGFFVEGYMILHTDDEVLYYAFEDAVLRKEAIELEIAEQKDKITTQEAIILELEEEKEVLETTAAALALELEGYEDTYQSYLDKMEVINAAENKVKRLERLVDDREEMLAVLLGSQSAAELYEQYLISLQMDIDYYEALIEDLQTILEEKEEAYAQARVPMLRRRLLTEIISLTMQIEDAQAELDYLEDLLDEADVSQDDIDFIGQVVDRVREELAIAEDKLEQAEEALLEAIETLTDEEKEAADQIELILEKILDLNEAIQMKTDEIEAAQSSRDLMVVDLIMLQEALAEAIDDLNEAGLTYLNALPLSIPYIGFMGDWSDAETFDISNYEGGGFYEMTAMLDELGYFAGYNVGYEAFIGSASGFSPNGDDYREQAVPLYSLLRSMLDLSFVVTDDEGREVKRIGSMSEERKNWFDSGNSPEYKYHPDLYWDGTEGMTLVEDGQYYYVISGYTVGTDGQPDAYKELTLPIKVDTVSPVIEAIDYVMGDDEMIIYTEDGEGTGVGYFELLNEADYTSFAVSYDGVFDMTDVGIADTLIYIEDYAGNGVIYDGPIVNDDINPDITIDIEPYGLYDTREITTYGEVSDDLPTLVTINGHPVEFAYPIGDSASPDSYAEADQFKYSETFDSDGLKVFRVDGVDAAGNAIGYERKFYIDSMPPVITSTKDDLNQVVYVDQETETYEVDLTVSDNFPNMIVKVNNSEVYTNSVDYISYHNLLQPVSYNYKTAMTLEDGSNVIYIEGLDDTGVSTLASVTVYRLQEGETNPMKELAEIHVLNDMPMSMSIGASRTLDLEYMLVDGTILSEMDQVQVSANPANRVTIDGLVITGRSSGETTITIACETISESFKVTVLPRASTGNTTPVTTTTSTVTDTETITDEELAQALPEMLVGPYLDGYPDGSFKPEGLIKRSEMAKMLHGILTLEDGSETDFNDVASTHWAFSHIATMEKAGLIDGYDDGSFKAETTIKRSEMAAILSRMMSKLELEVPTKESIYTDIDNHWAKEAIETIYAYGIEIEEGATSFEPEAMLTRAEAVVMINGLMKMTVSEDAMDLSYTDVAKDHWAYEAIQAASK